MNNIEKIVKLRDERNYLQNILEAKEETGLSLEEIIENKINYIYEEIYKLEKEN